MEPDETTKKYYITGIREPISLEEIKRRSKDWACPVKFFDENGMLIGTVYPNGDVQK